MLTYHRWTSRTLRRSGRAIFGILTLLFGWAVLYGTPAMAREAVLPDDNLIVNPWFRTGTRPSLDGWVAVGPPGGGWQPSQKPGNPTPDDVVGTAARLSTGRGVDRAGRTIDPNQFASLIQVVATDPDHRGLRFHMHWVAHTVDPVIVTVYGGPTPEGPWEEVWVPFVQRHTRVIRPESGRGNDLWDYYTALTPPVSTTLERGYPYYRVEISASLPDLQGGLKITGVYFTAAPEPDVTSRTTGSDSGSGAGPGASERFRITAGSREIVEIVRDGWGIAHVFAETDAGAFFGAGYATAQDRILQMELVRRAAAGISEDPTSPHYFDQVDLWVRGATRPAPLSRDAVLAYAESVQRIVYPPGSEPADPVRYGNADAGGSERAFLEPPDGYVYHGTSPHDVPDVEAYIAALGDPAIYPAVEGMHAAVPGTRPQSLERTIREFLERVRAAGRIPHLSFSLSIGDGEAVDDVIALTDTYDDLIRTVGRVIREFGDPVFIRIGFEFNGSWNNYHPGLYPVAFRKFVDLLREEGATNFATIWCYEPDGPADFDAVDADGEYLWYPGDDYVDWFGLDLFRREHFVSDAVVGEGGRPGSRVRESTYERTVRFLEMAAKHGKPVFLSEVAAVDVHLTPDHLDPDFVDGKSDWEVWFEPFFALLDEYPQIKGFNYMSQDYRNTKYAAQGWGDARIQVNRFVLERWIEALRDERFLHGGMAVVR